MKNFCRFFALILNLIIIRKSSDMFSAKGNYKFYLDLKSSMIHIFLQFIIYATIISLKFWNMPWKSIGVSLFYFTVVYCDLIQSLDLSCIWRYSMLLIHNCKRTLVTMKPKSGRFIITLQLLNFSQEDYRYLLESCNSLVFQTTNVGVFYLYTNALLTLSYFRFSFSSHNLV